jgi:16S rRNA processing protein RimM
VQAERVVVGRILKVFGIRGEVVVEAMGDDPERFASGTILFLNERGSESVTIRESRVHGGGYLITFDGRSDRTAVEDLAGRPLLQEADRLPPLPEGTYYHYQLVGLAVTVPDGSRLGSVEQILSIAGTDLYQVRGPAGEWLIPGRKEFVEWIDLNKGELRLTGRVDLLKAQEKGESNSASAS